jgi:prepilin-type N-terminal cleavage/methylation domain-containing protein
MKSRLAGFTVMEFIVAMVISSIIIGLGYQAWGMLSVKTFGSARGNRIYEDINTLDYLMRRDFIECQRSSYFENELSFEHSDRRISYRFDDEQVIRKSENIDTFYVEVDDIEVEYTNPSSSNEFVKQIAINVKIDKQKLTYCFKKNYSATQLERLISQNEY